jgi:hypothetical protein
LGIGHGELGIGHWALGMGHGALGMGHWAWGIGEKLTATSSSSLIPLIPPTLEE